MVFKKKLFFAIFVLICLGTFAFSKPSSKKSSKAKKSKEEISVSAEKDDSISTNSDSVDAQKSSASSSSSDGADNATTDTDTIPEKKVLTVDDAVKQALENNKSLKSSEIDFEIKKRASQFSWNTFLPSLGINGTVARQNNLTSTLDTANQSIIGSNATMGLIKGLHGTATDPVTTKILSQIKEIPLVEDEEKRHWAIVAPSISASWNFNLAMIDAIRVAKVQYEAGEITLDKAQREMEVNIRKMFYGLLLSQENLNIQKEKLDNARERYNQAAINYRNGLVPEMSVLNAQVTYENQKPTVMSTENSLKQTMNLFAFLLGLPYGTEIELKGSIDVNYIKVDANELVQKYLEENKDILALKKSIELLNLSINATRLSTFTPSLALSWGFSPRLYAGGEWADNLLDADSGSLSLTLVYQNLFNMLPFSANMQKLKDTQQQLRQAELGLEQLVQNTEMEIHTLVDNLQKCEANIRAMEKTVALARLAYQSTLKSYRSGTAELLEVQESENSYNQARLGLSSEKNNYISALLDLETKLNIKLQ